MTVRNSEDGSPIRGARMIWTKKEGNEDSFETTNSRGQVTLLKKRPYGTETARVEVTVSKEGFETQTQVSNNS